MLSTRSLILPSSDRNKHARVWSTSKSRKFAQGIRVGQNALAFGIPQTERVSISNCDPFSIYLLKSSALCSKGEMKCFRRTIARATLDIM